MALNLGQEGLSVVVADAIHLVEGLPFELGAPLTQGKHRVFPQLKTGFALKPVDEAGATV